MRGARCALSLECRLPKLPGPPGAEINRQETGSRHIFVDSAFLEQPPDSCPCRFNWVSPSERWSLVGLHHASVLNGLRNAACVPKPGFAVLQIRSDRCISSQVG